MKTKFVRAIVFLLLSVFVLSCFAGCDTNNGTTNTQENTTAPQETEGNKPDDNTTKPSGKYDLTDYSIVLSSKSMSTATKLAAYELKDYLKGRGFDLPVVRDSSAAAKGGKSIRMGETAMMVGTMPTGDDYSITDDADGNIQILAGSYYGYREALRYIRLKGGISKGISQSGNATPALAAKADGTIRAMFYNVYGWDNWKKLDGTTASGNDAPSLALRQDLQRDLFESYQPDVLGFQEYMADSYHAKFNSVLTELGYAQVDVSKGSANCTPLFYKKDKLEVVEKGYILYDCSDDTDSKSVTWAVFREKSSGKLVSVFSTHFMWNMTKDEGAKWDKEREDNAKELVALVNTVVAKYENIGAIIGGDLNYWNTTAGNSAPAYTVMVNGGLKYMISMTTAHNRATTESYHGYHAYDGSKSIFDTTKNTLTTSKYTLDYIFFGGSKNKTEIKSYYIISDDITMRASDHCPTFTDIVLK